MTEPRISLTIDRLVLHGVDRADAAAVRRALNAELQTLLARADFEGVPGGGGADLRLSIGPASQPHALGRSAGAAIARALASPAGART